MKIKNKKRKKEKVLVELKVVVYGEKERDNGYRCMRRKGEKMCEDDEREKM